MQDKIDVYVKFDVILVSFTSFVCILVGLTSQKTGKCLPTSVVVNPLIHHPSFYGLPATAMPMKSTATSSSISTLVPHASISSQPSSMSSNSVVINPLLLSSNNVNINAHNNNNNNHDNNDTVLDLKTKTLTKQPQIKMINHEHRTLNAVVKSSDLSNNDWKISIKHIFEQFAFNIDYQKFIQWCQTNSLLPLVRLDDDEKQLYMNGNNDEHYVCQRHLERCIALLNDLKRGTISMTLLPAVSNDSQVSLFTTGKTSLAGILHESIMEPLNIHPLLLFLFSFRCEETQNNGTDYPTCSTRT
jgi:hypothetical protein